MEENSAMETFKSPTFISLEGLSGVGKSDTAEALASAINGEFVHLTTDFASAKRLMTRPEDVDARMCLFATAMLYSSVRIQDRLVKGISVVVDGFLARTIAYHRGMGAKLSIDPGAAIRTPDFSIMLMCEERERRQRIAVRNRPQTIWDQIELANLDRIRELYEQNDFPTVDTTTRSTADIVSDILKLCGLDNAAAVAI